MPNYDSILLCSDFDGTLAIQKHISERNISAVNKFMKKGGLFTICTGRTYHYITDIFDKIEPNTLIISLNGASLSIAPITYLRKNMLIKIHST